MKKNSLFFLLFAALTVAFVGDACKGDPPMGGETKGDLEDIAYNPQPYSIKKPDHFPAILIPSDNPMTLAGVQLGRRLFYDPILSADSSMSCSSCHLPAGSFTDNKSVSKGIDGLDGRRSSMSLLNIAYANNGLFWDGRAKTLEEQALLPVEDAVELHHTWVNVVEDLKRHPVYPKLFREAFGVKDRKEITKELAAKAIAQFERILISSGNSKFDRFVYYQEPVFDDFEQEGLSLYNNTNSIDDAQCFHCHGGITLTGNQFFSNGLDNVTSFNDFSDKGLGMVTGKPEDNGKFRAPTLRNIALTAPYMHDGRFKTLEEVVEHYASQGKSKPPFQDPFVGQVGSLILGSNPPQYAPLSNFQKKSLVRFLQTLTDSTFINNPDIRSPF